MVTLHLKPDQVIFPKSSIILDQTAILPLAVRVGHISASRPVLDVNRKQPHLFILIGIPYHFFKS